MTMESESKRNKEYCPIRYEKKKNQKEISAYHENLNNILESHKSDTVTDTDKGWMFIKETINQAASLFKKESQTKEKLWFDDGCRDITEK